MKKLLNIFRTNHVLKNAACFIGALFLALGLILVGGQVGNFRVSNITTAYSAKSSKLMLTKVKLKDNDVFKNDSEGYYTSNGGFYVASLIDKIHIDFYDTLMIYDSEKNDIKVIKSVTATLVVESAEGEILQEVKSVERPGFVSQETETYSNKSSIVINKGVELDYNEFFVRFSSINASLSGIQCTSYLKINYNINCSGKIDGETFSYNDNLTSYVDVQNNGSVRFENSYTPSSNMKKDTEVFVNNANYISISLGAIFVLVGVALLSIVVCVIAQQMSEDKNKKYIRKICANYLDLIVESKSDIATTNKLKIKVDAFDDLLKVEAELSQPIILYKNENIWNFYVVDNEILYNWVFDENENNEIDNEVVKQNNLASSDKPKTQTTNEDQMPDEDNFHSEDNLKTDSNKKKQQKNPVAKTTQNKTTATKEKTEDLKTVETKNSTSKSKSKTTSTVKKPSTKNDEVSTKKTSSKKKTV